MASRRAASQSIVVLVDRFAMRSILRVRVEPIEPELLDRSSLITIKMMKYWNEKNGEVEVPPAIMVFCLV